MGPPEGAFPTDRLRSQVCSNSLSKYAEVVAPEFAVPSKHKLQPGTEQRCTTDKALVEQHCGTHEAINGASIVPG